MAKIYDFEMSRLNGISEKLSLYKGKVLLIINVASRCGYTPQYEGFEALYRDFKSKGFEILGFPCNQFGSQESGSAEQIEQFCQLTYGVSFPMFEKIDVNGAKAAPLYQYLKSKAPGILGTKAIKWNFTKFLVNREGKVVQRFGPSDDAGRVRGAVESLI